MYPLAIHSLTTHEKKTRAFAQASCTIYPRRIQQQKYSRNRMIFPVDRVAGWCILSITKQGNNAMTAPFKACTIRESFGPNMEKRYIVQLDLDAAEIMGETKLRYIYISKIGAERFAATIQANFDAAYDDATNP